MSALVTIRGAGSSEVNGDFISTAVLMDGVPVFMMSRPGADGIHREYSVCRSVSSKTKTKKWWICRTDRNGLDKDIDFYTCDNESDAPPSNGWTPLRGELPVPQVQVSSGSMSVLEVFGAGAIEANGDYARLSATMDGVPKYLMMCIGEDGVRREYTVCRSVSTKTKTKKWWMCRTDRNGIESDVDFYTCESASDTPPLSGWAPLKGKLPLPSLQFANREALAEPLLDTPAAIKTAISKLTMSAVGMHTLSSLLVAAEASPVSGQQMLAANIMLPLLRIFAADVTNTLVLRLLYVLASLPDNVPELLRQGLLPALHQCCETWPDEVKRPAVNAITILSKISVSEKTERPMVDAGLHVCLLWAAEQADTRESAFNALLNIAFAKDCKQPLLDVGAIQVALKYGRDDTNSSAFKFLRSMSLHPPAFSKFAEVGIVALLKRNLSKNYRDEQNIWFVSNLSDLPEACVQICETGCLPFLKIAMDDISPADPQLRFRSWAITAVWRIAKVERCRPALLNARLQDALVEHTRKSFEPVLAMMGLALLVGRAEEGVNSQLIQASMSVVKRLLECLESSLAEYVSGRSAFVKTKCSVTDYLKALACLATSDSRKAELASQDVLLLLLRCCEQCLKENETVRIACDLLLELTFSPMALKVLQDRPVQIRLAELRRIMTDPIGAQKMDSLLFRVSPQHEGGRRKSEAYGLPAVRAFIPAVEGVLPPPYAAAAASVSSSEQKQGVSVYLSYHFEHQLLACRLRDDLKARGFSVWIDVEQGSGPDERAEGIEAANVVLMDISTQYKESANCRLEAQYASQLKKKIIPMLLEPHYSPTGWLGMVVANLRPHRCWNDGDYPEFVKSLTLELGAGKGISGSSAPPPYAAPPDYEPSKPGNDFVAVPPPSAPPSVVTPAKAAPAIVVSKSAALSPDAEAEWNCAACTYLNSPDLRACEVCESPRMSQPAVPSQPSVPPRLPVPPQPSAPPLSMVSTLEAKNPDQVSLKKLQEQTEVLVQGHVQALSQQLSQALGNLTSLQASAATHERDLETLRQAINKEPQALPALVQAAISTPEYEDMLAQTERRLQSCLRSHASGIEAQIGAVTVHLSSVSAKTDAIYAVYAQQRTLLLEQEALLKSTIAPFYNATNAVLSARLQAVLLVASGVLQAKQGAIVERSSVVASGIGAAAQQAVSLAAEVSALAADAVPLVGAVLGALVRKGAESLDEYRSKKRQHRVAAQAVTTADAETLGELAARRCAQLFASLVDADKARLDEESLEKAGRKAGQTMYDAIVGGSFDSLLDEAEKKDSKLKDQELTARALSLAVQKRAMTTTGILKREGGIFVFKLTQADVEKIVKENSAGLSPAEKLRRTQAEELQRAQASQLELLRKQMEVAVLSPRAKGEEPRASPASKPSKAKDVPNEAKQDVAVEVWLEAHGFSDLIPTLQGMFESVRKLILAFQGLNPRDLREELGLKGLPGLAVATKLREALDKEGIEP